MNIVINGQNLQKRIINGQEVQKVIRNGVQIRPESTPSSDDYLCFTSDTTLNTNNVTLRQFGTPYEVQLEISYDKSSWSDYTIGTTISLASGEKVYFRNKSESVVSFSKSSQSYYNFMTTGDGVVYASGDVNFLLCKYSTTNLSLTQPYTFANLFYYSLGNLISAPKLPATILQSQCYYGMFTSSRIMTAPELPATTLTANCYEDMFYGCSLLTTPPELPATTGAVRCYRAMFNGCYMLTSLPLIHLNYLDTRCCENMFEGCDVSISETQTGAYTTSYPIPDGGTNATRNMFANTSGTFTGTPNLNTTYYTSNTVI